VNPFLRPAGKDRACRKCGRPFAAQRTSTRSVCRGCLRRLNKRALNKKEPAMEETPKICPCAGCPHRATCATPPEDCPGSQAWSPPADTAPMHSIDPKDVQ
jgi:hypothetical protein